MDANGDGDANGADGEIDETMIVVSTPQSGPRLPHLIEIGIKCSCRRREAAYRQSSGSECDTSYYTIYDKI